MRGFETRKNRCSQSEEETQRLLFLTSLLVVEPCGYFRYCLIGAGAVVTKDVKPYRIVYGNPARDEGWISPEGNRLEQAEGADEKLLEDPSTGRRYRITEDDILEPFMKSEAS